jgi:hypothetical protein
VEPTGGHGVYEEARRWLDQGTKWLEAALQRKPEENPLSWDQRFILEHLRREAESLLGAGPGSPDSSR